MISLTNEDDVLKRLSSRLREERIRVGWRQVDLARNSGVPLPTLRKFETNGLINTSALARLLVSLGMADRLLEAIKPEPRLPATIQDFVRSAHSPKERRRVRLTQRA